MNTVPSTNGHIYGTPLSGPLDAEPSADRVEAAEMWRIAGRYVGQAGLWDQRIQLWLRGRDAGLVATVASWLRRAWDNGHVAGLDAARDDDPVPGAWADRLVARYRTRYASMVERGADRSLAVATLVGTAVATIDDDAALAAVVRAIADADAGETARETAALDGLVADLAAAGIEAAAADDDTAGGAS